MKILSMQRVRDLYAELNPNGHWFDKRTLEFFASQLPATAELIGECAYFVSSEKKGFTSSERAFSVRCFNTKTGDIGTVGDFLGYETKAAAKAAISEIRNKQREPA
jgi:hypothetical protein